MAGPDGERATGSESFSARERKENYLNECSDNYAVSSNLARTLAQNNPPQTTAQYAEQRRNTANNVEMATRMKTRENEVIEGRRQGNLETSGLSGVTNTGALLDRLANTGK